MAQPHAIEVLLRLAVELYTVAVCAGAALLCVALIFDGSAVCAGAALLCVALIFDGSHVKQHEWLGDLIGQYWVEVTGGRGYHHNCNRGTYKYPGTGLIDHHDAEKRENVMRTLMYLAKKDQFVRVKASPKSKTFMTGHLPEPLVGRTGRSRTKGMPELPGDVFPDDDDNVEAKVA